MTSRVEYGVGDRELEGLRRDGRFGAGSWGSKLARLGIILLCVEAAIWAAELNAGFRLLPRPWRPSGPTHVLVWDEDEKWLGFASTLGSRVRAYKISPGKPERKKRAVVFGGSVAKGIDVGLCEEMLRGRSSDRVHWEVITAGGLGFASRDVYRVWQDFSRKVEFDVAVFAMGHNEFTDPLWFRSLYHHLTLKNLLLAIPASLFPSRFGALVQVPEDDGGIREVRLRTPVLPDLPSGERGGFVVRYKGYLQLMLAEARERGIASVVVLLPSNPLFPPGCLGDARPGVGKRFVEASLDVFRLIQSGELGQASRRYERVLGLRPEAAPQAFHDGLQLLVEGQVRKARTALDKSRDLDPHPVRDTSAMYAAGVEAAAGAKVLLLDIRETYRVFSDLNGWDTVAPLFRDYCHPGESGSRLLVEEISEAIIDALSS